MVPLNLTKVPPEGANQRYRRSRNDGETRSRSVACGPGVTSVVARLARRNEIPTLICGLARCNGPVGRLHASGVRRTFPFPLPEVIPGIPPAFQALVEAQAPDIARCGIAYVLPEGFKQFRPSGIWEMTRRGRERQHAIHNNWLPLIATHRRMPRAAGIELLAIAPPLLAEVRCPECRRINVVTSELLNTFVPDVMEQWNADVAGETGGWLRSLWHATTDGRGVARAEQPDPRPAKRTSVPHDMAMTAMFLTPRFTLLSESVLGRSIGIEDFFVIEPARPYWLPVPDPDLEHWIRARAQAMQPLADREGPR